MGAGGKVATICVDTHADCLSCMFSSVNMNRVCTGQRRARDSPEIASRIIGHVSLCHRERFMDRITPWVYIKPSNPKVFFVQFITSKIDTTAIRAEDVDPIVMAVVLYYHNRLTWKA